MLVKQHIVIEEEYIIMAIPMRPEGTANIPEGFAVRIKLTRECRGLKSKTPCLERFQG